jgi:hypothetical protein
MRSPTHIITKIYLIRASFNVGERIALPRHIIEKFKNDNDIIQN